MILRFEKPSLNRQERKKFSIPTLFLKQTKPRLNRDFVTPDLLSLQYKNYFSFHFWFKGFDANFSTTCRSKNFCSKQLLIYKRNGSPDNVIFWI